MFIRQSSLQWLMWRGSIPSPDETGVNGGKAVWEVGSPSARINQEDVWHGASDTLEESEQKNTLQSLRCCHRLLD
jgi:hypothetical protein